MSTDTNTDNDRDHAGCDGCGKGVLPLFELQGDDADPEADVLCAQCAADADTGEVTDR